MRNGIVTAGVIAALAAAAYGCGGTDVTGTGGSDTTTSTVSSTGTGGKGGESTSSVSVSASSSSSSSSSGTGGTPVVCTPSDGTVLAVDTFDFGDKGTDTSASQKLGFNVDGLVSTAQSADLCQPVMGGSKAKIYPDGDMGIDNSFGKNILPLLLQVQSGFSDAVTNNIADGKFTMMFDFVGLTGANPSPATLTTRLYGGTDLGMPPSFDGKDCWPVAPELLKDTKDITSSTLVFDKSAITGDKWSSGPASVLTLTIPIATTTIKLTIHKASMALDFAADRQSATGGVIGGVLDTEELVAEVKKAIFALQGNAGCQLLKTFGVEASMRQSSDILNDGSQNAASTCNGISIGFGFTMKPVQLGGVGPATPPAMGTCP